MFGLAIGIKGTRLFQHSPNYCNNCWRSAKICNVPWLLNAFWSGMTIPSSHNDTKSKASEKFGVTAMVGGVVHEVGLECWKWSKRIEIVEMSGLWTQSCQLLTLWRVLLVSSLQNNWAIVVGWSCSAPRAEGIVSSPLSSCFCSKRLCKLDRVIYWCSLAKRWDPTATVNKHVF